MINKEARVANAVCSVKTLSLPLILSVSHMLSVPIVGVGKERRTKNWSIWCYCPSGQHALLELPLGLLVLCWWTLGGERHRYAIA